MTLPTTDPLPIVQAGLIWDGETEYQDILPPGVSQIYLLRMYGDKTRRFSKHLATVAPMTKLLQQKAAGWEQIGISFEDAGFHLNTGFLAYDGTISLEPVNQWFLLNQFREHASRFAHQLDDALGHHSLSSSSEEDRMVTYQTLQLHDWQRLEAVQDLGRHQPRRADRRRELRRHSALETPGE